MNKMRNKIGLLLLVGVLSSCGYGLREIYTGDAYNSPIFGENYYRHYDEAINPNIDNQITETVELRLTDLGTAYATNYADAYILDEQIPAPGEVGETTVNGVQKLTYADYEDKDNPNSIGKKYGATKRMSLVDPIFSKGYVSKLFDGQMFCNGYYQLARVQIDEGGFGATFEKELVDQTGSYFALNFKAADNNILNPDEAITGHISRINIHISFFLRNSKGYKEIKVSHEMDAYANPSEMYVNYNFLAFSLERIDITRCAGIGISYDLLDDDMYNGNEDIEHSLMLYEMMIPYAIWR
ncbi:MAG: hypothetical protein LBM03_01225 [Erysipelotrichaceae bacterium]|jgi:hypothetical protein|nr:hypothetical protein [Erysipelotrichaceae bacterium]